MLTRKKGVWLTAFQYVLIVTLVLLAWQAHSALFYVLACFLTAMCIAKKKINLVKKMDLKRFLTVYIRHPKRDPDFDKI